MKALPLLVPALIAALAPAAPAEPTARCAAPGFAAAVPLPVPSGTVLVRLVGTGDVDGDGAPEVVLEAPLEGRLLVFRNDGRGSFPAVEAIGVVEPVAGVVPTFAATVADVDGDGRADLVGVRGLPGAPASTGSLVVWRSSDGGFLPPVPSEATLVSPGTAPLLGDVDGDGRPDLLATTAPADGGTDADVSWLGNLGDGRFGPPRPIPAAAGLRLLAAADLNGDGHLDLVATTPSWPTVALALLAGDGHGGFTRGSVFFEGLSVNEVAVRDLDGDGRPDLVLTESYKFVGVLDVLLADGAGGFRRSFSLSGPVMALAAGDVDRDGVLDLVVASASAPESLAVHLGDGTGGFPRRVPLAFGIGRPGLADLDRDGALDLLRVPGSPPELASVHRNDCRAGEATRTLLVPVVASLPGANGAAYRTRLTLANLSPVAVPLEAVFTPIEGEPVTGTTTLAGASQSSRDAVAFLEALGIPVADPSRVVGTLRLTASGLLRPDDLAAEARVQVARSGDDPGSSGVSFPALPVDEAFDGAVLLGGLREDGRDRTNLGLVNAGGAGDGDVVLRVTLFPSDPALAPPATLPDVRLGPGRLRQLDRVLSLAAPSFPGGFARVERVSGSARFFAYSVVNDEGTSDGSFLVGVPAGSGRGSRRLVVPSVVEAGAYTTDLFLANASALAKDVRLEWFADGLSSPSGAVSLALSLPPSSQLLLDDLVARLRSTGAAVPPRGASLAGALFLSVETGDVEGLLAGSRVTAPAAEAAGRYGVFLPAVPETRLATGPVLLPVSQPACVARTNVAIVNAGDPGTGTASFRLEARDGSTGALLRAESGLVVGPRGFLQLSTLVPPCAPVDREILVTITPTAGGAPFLAYGVVNDGARPGEGTGDGAVVSMRRLPPP